MEATDRNTPAAPAAGPAVALPPLPFRCNVWIHFDKKRWTVDSYKCIYSATRVEDVWQFFNHVDLIGGLNQFYFFAMKDRCQPVWEDSANHGHVTIRVSAVHAEQLFYTLLALWFAGELHADNAAINGVTIHTPEKKPNISVVAIWQASALPVNKYHREVTSRSPRYTAFRAKATYNKSTYKLA